MPKLEPTLGVRDTAANTKNFMRTNKDALWSIVKTIAPWLIILYSMDILVSHLYFPDSKNGFVLGEIIASYFFTVFVISWHRVAIHGPENAVMMNPFKPKKHELVFIGVGIMMGVIAIIVGALVAASVLIHPAVGFVAIIAFVLAFAYFFYKISFYFPAKAVNCSITFKESFALTKGYFWKMAGSYFLASLRYIGGVILYILALAAVALALGMILGDAIESPIVATIMDIVLLLPLVLYFYPLFYAVGVTVLSNYYQHALQNKS